MNTVKIICTLIFIIHSIYANEMNSMKMLMERIEQMPEEMMDYDDMQQKIDKMSMTQMDMPMKMMPGEYDQMSPMTMNMMNLMSAMPPIMQEKEDTYSMDMMKMPMIDMEGMNMKQMAMMKKLKDMSMMYNMGLMKANEMGRHGAKMNGMKMYGMSSMRKNMSPIMQKAAMNYGASMMINGKNGHAMDMGPMPIYKSTIMMPMNRGMSRQMADRNGKIMAMRMEGRKGY